jgi:hypothetical protein
VAPTCAIQGRFAADVRPFRVIVIQLFGSYSTSVPAAGGGSFEVGNLECGDYLPAAEGSSKYIGSATARATLAPTPVEVTLSH